MSSNDSGQPLAGTERPAQHSRLGGVWVLLVLGAAILVLLLVFILQNTQHVQVHLYGAHLDAPLGVALLLASALGVLLVVVPGGGRILQLRRATKQLHREREHLAGRLDDITGATDQGDDDGSAAAQSSAGPRTSTAPGSDRPSAQTDGSAQSRSSDG